MEELLNILHSIYPLQEGMVEWLTIHLKVKEIRKKEYLLKSGHVCRNVYFIEKGLLRCFYREDHREICSWFMKEGDVIFSVESFYAQVPSYEFIQALEDCSIYYISYPELQEVYSVFPDFNRHGRILTEKYYRYLWNYTYVTRMKRSGERYENLLKHFPDLAGRVPNKYLASYLGITEETLSRIRSGKKY